VHLQHCIGARRGASSWGTGSINNFLTMLQVECRDGVSFDRGGTGARDSRTVGLGMVSLAMGIGI
jgi:hypothetical protein